MSAKLLTQQIIDRARPRSKPYELMDSTFRGFVLRVQPSGVKTYYLNVYGDDRKFGRRVRLGRASSMTYIEALSEARRVKREFERRDTPSLRMRLDHMRVIRREVQVLLVRIDAFIRAAQREAKKK